MSAEDLWGELPPIPNIKTPVQILKDQASLLTQKTKGVVVGTVNQTKNPRPFEFSLLARAPALNNYIVRLADISYPVEMYPLYFTPFDEPPISCENEASFGARLKATCGNTYRLVCAIHYNTGKVFLLRFLTHAEYAKNRWKDEL